MKKMAKFVVSFMLVAVIIGASFALVACNGDDKNYVAVAAIDLLQEDFGIAVKKGNTALLNAVNVVIDEWLANGKMNQYMDYYSALANEEKGGESAVAPDGLQMSWDFGSATEVVTMYTEAGFAPYEFYKGENIVGLDVAIMSQVAVNLGKKLEVKDVVFDVVATNVANSTGDAVGAAGITINDERKQVIDFSNVYSSSTLVIVSENGQYSSVKDLTGKTVGVQEGTSGDLIISAAKGAGYTYENEDGQDVTVTSVGATVKQYKQYALALQDLKNGRIDAILMDKIPAELMLK